MRSELTGVCPLRIWVGYRCSPGMEQRNVTQNRVKTEHFYYKATSAMQLWPFRFYSNLNQ